MIVFCMVSDNIQKDITAMTAAARHRHSCFYWGSAQNPEKVHGPLDLFHQCVEHLGS